MWWSHSPEQFKMYRLRFNIKLEPQNNFIVILISIITSYICIILKVYVQKTDLAFGGCLVGTAAACTDWLNPTLGGGIGPAVTCADWLTPTLACKYMVTLNTYFCSPHQQGFTDLGICKCDKIRFISICCKSDFCTGHKEC